MVRPSNGTSYRFLSLDHTKATSYKYKIPFDASVLSTQSSLPSPSPTIMTATCLFGPLFKLQYSQSCSSVCSNRPKLQFIADKYMTKWDEQYIKAYYHKWELLMKSMSIAAHDAIWPIRFAEIPWPVSPALVKEIPDPVIITRANITRFLIPYPDDRHSCLEAVLNELDRWDDFELMVKISGYICRADKKKVQEAWSRVVLILMEMRGDYSSSSSLALSDV